jgi:hypothetical protein
MSPDPRDQAAAERPERKKRLYLICRTDAQMCRHLRRLYNRAVTDQGDGAIFAACLILALVLLAVLTGRLILRILFSL